MIWKLKPASRGTMASRSPPTTSSSPRHTPADPASATYTIATYRDLKVEKIDVARRQGEFRSPRRSGPSRSSGPVGTILPKHLLRRLQGRQVARGPANLKPVGTGPYKFVDFKPGDMLRAERNPTTTSPTSRFFDTLEVKGGGDAAQRARAVLQTGEFDYAWNLQVEDEILKRMEAGGKGKIGVLAGSGIEFISLNPTDPWTEVDGERSSVKTRHPTLSDPAVREAINLLIDRNSVSEFIYGRGGVATGELHQRADRSIAARTRSSNSTSTRPTRSSTTPAGRRVRTASARRATEAEIRLPDLDQRAAPEDPGHHQAGLHQAGIEIEFKSDHRVGVLRRCR